MWKKEDLQNKYVELFSQQDYETVTKVLHEFGFKVYHGDKNDKYYEEYPFVKIKSTNVYYLYFEPEFTEIPIQQFYDYLSSKTLKVEDLVEGEIYKSSYGNDWFFKYNKNNNETVYYVTPTAFSKSSWGFYKNKSIIPAKTEEKKHLQVCIKQNKFINKTDLHLYDDATFELKSQTITEYVECVECNTSEYIKGKIYKLEEGKIRTETNYLPSEKYKLNQYYYSYNFKFSTKEAFEAQNKPKFEVGRWYKSNERVNHWYYLKVNSFDANCAYGERIYKDDNENYFHEKRFLLEC